MDISTPEDVLAAAGAITTLARKSLEPVRERTTNTRRQPKQEPQRDQKQTSDIRFWTNPADLHGQPVPERRWIVQDWLPCGHVTLNYGDGGTGKTLLAQQLMTSTATALPWCGLGVQPCRSYGFFAEDDEGELHRRQLAICEAYGVSLADLGEMRWHSGVGRDNLLVVFDGYGVAQPTPLFEHIKKEAKKFEAELVVIDTAADTFGGNENNRGEVRQFIGRILNDLAQHIGGAVLLNAHPSRSGLSATGDMDGGSTGWSNSARSRWSLSRPTADADEQADSDARILTRRKANYATIGDSIRLRWDRGALVPLAPTYNRFTAASEADHAERTFLALLDRCNASNLPVSTSKNAGNFAPKMFSKRPDAEGLTAKDFDAAMSRLFTNGAITMVNYGRKGDERRRIARPGAVRCEAEGEAADSA
jgi:RecA-family ATPase